MKDSSVVVAVILDREGLQKWRERLNYLIQFKPDHGKTLTILDFVFQPAEGKEMLDSSGVIWTWSRTAWEGMDSVFIQCLRDELKIIPSEHLTILGDTYWQG